MADADACGKCGIRVRGRLAEDASRNAVQPIVHLRRFGPSDAVDDVPHIYSPPAAGATDRLAQRDKSQNAKIAKVFCVFLSNKEVLSSFLNLSAHPAENSPHLRNLANSSSGCASRSATASVDETHVSGPVAGALRGRPPSARQRETQRRSQRLRIAVDHKQVRTRRPLRRAAPLLPMVQRIDAVPKPPGE